MERLLMDLRAAFPRIRPWCLRAAALLRLGALVVSAPLLLHAGALGVVLAIWLAGAAIGLWRRLLWPWRAALLGDIVLVVVSAMQLLESGNLHLFTYIAAGAAVEVVLLGVGQGALDLGMPPQ